MSAFVVLLCVLLVPATGWTKCPPDMVSAGPTCIDKYEASVWRIPTRSTKLMNKVRRGVATLADLQAGGAEPVSRSGNPDQPCDSPYPASFPPTGDWTEPLYALSVGGVLPTGCTTWFQAEPTGLATACVSRWGASDMIGNVAEWVADWVPNCTSCPEWPVPARGDFMCLAGASTTDGPGALLRGGSAQNGSFAGSLAVVPGNPARGDASSIGFRCAR